MRPPVDIEVMVGEVTSASRGFVDATVDGQSFTSIPVDRDQELQVGTTALLIKVDRRVVCAGEFTFDTGLEGGGGGET